MAAAVSVTDDDNPSAACPAAEKVAGSVIETLKKGS